MRGKVLGGGGNRMRLYHELHFANVKREILVVDLEMTNILWTEKRG